MIAPADQPARLEPLNGAAEFDLLDCRSNHKRGLPQDMKRLTKIGIFW
jgi:hypothetical protein